MEKIPIIGNGSTGTIEESVHAALETALRDSPPGSVAFVLRAGSDGWRCEWHGNPVFVLGFLELAKTAICKNGDGQG